MTIQIIPSDAIENFTIATNPIRQFTSSSLHGSTGSVRVFSRHSSFEKDNIVSSAFLDSKADDVNIDLLLNSISLSVISGATNINSSISQYMSMADAASVSTRKSKELGIDRFIPPFTQITNQTMTKLFMKDNLMPFYRHNFSSYNWNYVNYHSLNFFTASSVPSNSVLLYPNDFAFNVDGTFLSGGYNLSGAFTIDFYINPRYTNDNNSSFKAGTLLHLSSSYAVSLISGSSKDYNGFVDGYRILLQLSHSADVIPSLALPGGKPNDLTFLSNDNVLHKNNWHHVIITWGTNTINNGTGSFYVDGQNAGTFVIPSSSITPNFFPTQGNVDVLFVGNYYEGNNTDGNITAKFFGGDPSLRDGLVVIDGDTGFDYPDNYKFNHPLNAEVHDVSIRNYYTSTPPTNIAPSNLNNISFYLPPFFTTTSPYRQFVGETGGIPITPFFSKDGTTIDPFSVEMSFGVAGRYLNLENFTYDFGSKNFPRLLFLTATNIDTSTEAKTCNEFLYDMPGVRKRNVSILPCDDGNFSPNFNFVGQVITSSIESSKYTDALGVIDYSYISLDNMVSETFSYRTIETDSGSFFDSITGVKPEVLRSGEIPGAVYSIFQRTRDPSSNEIVMFNISNLFYGNRIYPGSLTITDSAITGTDGKISITLKDDGYGGLYRADALTPHATWNSVGNVFYNEGLLLIKSPEIPFFGKEQYNLTFKGDQNIHVLKVNVFANANQLNSSSNASYMPLSASLDANDNDSEFVYLSGINFHDDNFNVVMKSSFAQPLKKRIGDRYLIKAKMDF
jgi:hypothetical protein